MKIKLKTITKYLIELLIVAFGVFLGIIVSEQRGQQKIEQDVNKAINYILEELEVNRQSLESTIAYHEMIKKNLKALKPTLSEQDQFKSFYSNENFSYQDIEGWQGIQLPFLESIAYEGAKISGMTQHMDLELLNIISRVYRYQEFNVELGESILQRMMKLDSDTKTIDAIWIVESLTGDVLLNEKNLLKLLDKSIGEIQKLQKR